MSKIGVAQEHSTGANVTSLDDARRERRLDELCREHGAFLRRLAASLCRVRIFRVWGRPLRLVI